MCIGSTGVVVPWNRCYLYGHCTLTGCPFVCQDILEVDFGFVVLIDNCKGVATKASDVKTISSFLRMTKAVSYVSLKPWCSLTPQLSLFSYMNA